MTKLTLSVDEIVAAKAKKIARDRGNSISAIFSQFIESIPNGRQRKMKIGPLTRRLSGILKFPAGKDYKELLSESPRERRQK